MSTSQLLQPLALALVVVGSSGPPQGERNLLRPIETAYRQGEYVAARRHCEQAIETAIRNKDERAELAAVRQLALILDRLAEPGARDATIRASTLAERHADQPMQARLMLDESMRGWRRGEYSRSTTLAREALELAKRLADRALEASALSMLGRIDLKVGRYESASTQLRTAFDLHRELGDLSSAAEVLSELGSVELDQRQFASALDHFTESSRLAQQAHDLVAAVRAEEQIAIAWLFQGAPEIARSRLESLLRTASSAGLKALAAHVEYLLANALRQAGSHHEAVAAYERASTQLELHGDVREVAWIDSRRSRSELALGRYADAERSLAKALASWQRLDEARAAAYALYDLGRLQQIQGKQAEARATWERAVAAQRAIDLPYLALPLSSLGLLDLETDLARALALSAEAVQVADASGNPEMAWTARYRRGLVERHAGHERAALELFRESIAISESLREQVVAFDEALVGFGDARQELYAETATVLIEFGRLDEALQVSEQSRARALAWRIGGPAPRAKFEAIKLRQSARAQRLTVFEYVIGARTSAVLVIDEAGQLSAQALDLDGFSLRRHVAALRHTLEHAGDARPELRELYARLIAPVQGRLPAAIGSTLVIVPQAELHLVPFAALIDDRGRYLVEQCALSYLPALHLLRAAQPWPPQFRTLIVADPDSAEMSLPGARNESSAIAALLPAATTEVLIGNQATETLVRLKTPAAHLLHVATHAVFLPDRAEESYLQLAEPQTPSSLDDGRLTAREVLSHRLGARLVSLAACHSADGRVSADGVIGLSRSFLAAGADSVLSSQWRLADRPAQFQVTQFYRALLESNGQVVPSLRKAQLATLEALRAGELLDESGEPLAEHPVYWAPFVNLGSP